MSCYKRQIAPKDGEQNLLIVVLGPKRDGYPTNTPELWVHQTPAPSLSAARITAASSVHTDTALSPPFKPSPESQSHSKTTSHLYPASRPTSHDPIRPPYNVRPGLSLPGRANKPALHSTPQSICTTSTSASPAPTCLLPTG